MFPFFLATRILSYRLKSEGILGPKTPCGQEVAQILHEMHLDESMETESETDIALVGHSLTQGASQMVFFFHLTLRHED